MGKASYLDWMPADDSQHPDIAVHNNSIEDYADNTKRDFFKHVHSWLAPGGHFLFQAYSPDDEPMGKYIAEVSPEFATKNSIYLCNMEEYVHMAEVAGFEVVSK